MPPRPVQIHRQTAAAAALTLLVVLAYVLDIRSWVDGSESWLHTDGMVHLGRVQLFAEYLEGQSRDELRTILGYGPLVYLVSGAVMAVQDGHGWAQAVDGQLFFAAAGLLGTALVAARLAGPWAAPVAALLLASLPSFRAHTLDVMVDQPSTSLAALSLGLLLWADGFRRPWLSLAAGVVSGLALITRWPVAFYLGPVWALAVMLAALRARRGLRDGVAVVLIGGVTGVLLAGPPLLLSAGRSAALAPALAAGAGALSLAVVLCGLGHWRRDWALSAGGAALALSAVCLPLTLWEPETVLGATRTISDMQTSQASALSASPLPLKAERAVHVLAVWQWGPLVTLCALPGLLLLLRRRAGAAGPRSELLLLVLPAVVNLLVVLRIMNEPDERHVLAGLPGLVALAAALPFVLPGPPLLRRLGGGLLATGLLVPGLLGLFAWHGDLPGVISPERFRRDINLVREDWVNPFRPTWVVGGLPWASMRRFDGGVYGAFTRMFIRDVPPDGGACFALLVSPAIRGDLHVPDLVQRVGGQLSSDPRRIDMQDVYDRPGSLMAAYDGAVVFAEAGDRLVERVQASRPDFELVGSVDFVMESTRRTVPVTVLVDPVGASADSFSVEGCDGRFPGLELLPLGHGYYAGSSLPADLPE